MEQVRSKFSLSSAQELGGAFRTSVIAVQSESDPQQYLISIGSGSLLTPLSQGENGALARDYAATLTYVDSIRKQILAQDRKSTRLNSSHVRISYAVFCLKKKKKKKKNIKN